ncbi:MAG: arginine--tRNA ligase [Thermoprotei archaeon]|nr:MAG: arginine--tRNA ligase [Thermoprotei archaeon]
MAKLYSAHRVLVEEVRRAFQAALRDIGLEHEVLVERAPGGRGDLTVNFYRILRDANEAVKVAAEAANRAKSSLKFVRRIDVKGGFVNLYIDPGSYGPLVWSAVKEMGENYGYNPHPSPMRVLIEHTSANPVHPLHVGHLRNCVIGDALARLLMARGHRVETHFYVDDVGLQVAYAAYGYEKARGLKRRMKPDHYVGLIYSVVYTVVNVQELDKRRKSAISPEERARIDRELADWLWTAKELMEKDEELFTRISEAVKAEEDPVARIYEINRAYERREEWAVKLVREVTELCITGFKQTLNRLGVRFDYWDWESEVTVWNGLTDEVLRLLKTTGYVRTSEGALIFDAQSLAADNGVRAELGIPRSFAVMPLTLVRSDGTTLYATRDIAYSIWKFRRGVDRVINVIAVQQALVQVQVRLALYALGFLREARNLVHYSYEMVSLPGAKMSGRRGRYITADELIDEAIKRAGQELVKRGLELEAGREVAERVGIGAVKYAMLSVSPSKPLTFSWDKVLDFERNSGPFIQYAYVRARSILRRASGLKPELREGALGEEERRLLFLVGYFPELVAEAADRLKVELLPHYLNELALAFNKYYDEVPVIKAKPREKAEARLALVEMVATTLENGMRLMGVEAPHWM